MNIYYLGPAGSYSHTLVQKLFSDQKYIPCRSFSEIIECVKEHKASYGLLGIENSISSSVHESIDLLFANKEISIVAEACMNISLHLIGVSGSDISKIRSVYSYPQALAQCSEFVQSHGMRTVESPSTTAAVHEVDTLQNSEIAAIAGTGSIADTDLVVLQENIGNVSHNLTRWVVVTTQGKQILRKLNKMTMIFQVKHEPGSLVRVLQSIAENGGNMSKIESRPVAGSNWEYDFWVDIEIPEGSSSQFESLMKKEALQYRTVGIYEKGYTFE